MHTRRWFGTSFVALLCLLDAGIGGYFAYDTYNNTPKHTSSFVAQLVFILLFLVKFGFHAWILVDPSVTAGSGDRMKVNTFASASVLLNLIPILLEAPNIFCDDDFAASIFTIVTLAAPIFVTIFERSAYLTPDDSSSCFKHWKPWTDSAQEYPDF